MLNNQPKMSLKLFLKNSLKTAEGTGDLIGNPPKNSTIPSKTKIPRKRNISPKKDRKLFMNYD